MKKLKMLVLVLVAAMSAFGDTVKIDGDATYVDMTFTNATSTLSYQRESATKICYDAGPSISGEVGAKSTGLYLWCHPWFESISTFMNATNATLAVVGVMPSVRKTTFIHWGTANSGQHGVLLATGTSSNEVVVACNTYTTVTPIATMTVPDSTTKRHVYIITKEDTSSTTTFNVYLDSALLKTVSMDYFSLTDGGIQIGSDFSGNIVNKATGDNKYSSAATTDTGIINVVRRYDRVISAEEIARYSASDEYPCVDVEEEGDEDEEEEEEEDDVDGSAIAANGLTVADCRIAGLSTNDVNARFTASVEMKDGKVSLSWSPNLNTNKTKRIYTIYGRSSLDDEWMTPYQAWHKFFKVSVAKPTGADGETSAVAGESFTPISLPTVEAEVEADYVQLWPDGPYWATWNVGAKAPEDYGYYFRWGPTEGYKPVGETLADGTSHSVNTWIASTGEIVTENPFTTVDQTYNTYTDALIRIEVIDYDYHLTAKHDAATVFWGEKWRTPTADEVEGLLSNWCTITAETLNGIPGYRVTGKNSYSTKSVFFPSAGYFYPVFPDGTPELNYIWPGGLAYYWTSEPYKSTTARTVRFNTQMGSNSPRNAGLPVRPVRVMSE